MTIRNKGNIEKWIDQTNFLYYFVNQMRDYNRPELERLIDISRN